jgi:hypothetical protein
LFFSLHLLSELSAFSLVELVLEVAHLLVLILEFDLGGFLFFLLNLGDHCLFVRRFNQFGVLCDGLVEQRQQLVSLQVQVMCQLVHGLVLKTHSEEECVLHVRKVRNLSGFEFDEVKLG